MCTPCARRECTAFEELKERHLGSNGICDKRCSLSFGTWGAGQVELRGHVKKCNHLRMTGNSLGEGMTVPPKPSESSPKPMLIVQPLLTQGPGKGVEAGGACI